MPITNEQLRILKDEETRRKRTSAQKILDFLGEHRDTCYRWGELYIVLQGMAVGAMTKEDAIALGIAAAADVALNKGDSDLIRLKRDLQELVGAGKVRTEEVDGITYYFAA